MHTIHIIYTECLLNLLNSVENDLSDFRNIVIQNFK